MLGGQPAQQARAGVQSADLVGLRATRGQHEDGRRPSVPDQPAHLDALDVWQSQIENDEVRGNPFNVFQTPFNRYNIFAQANYEVSDNVEVYTRGLFSKNRASCSVPGIAK